MSRDPITIDFAIIGAAKSASTALHHYLRMQPGLFLPVAPELGYLLAPPGDETECELARQFYSDRDPDQLVGIKAVGMMLLPRVAARLAAHNPRCKAIAILRNPVDRAYSHYWFCRLRGRELAATFEEALARDRDGRLESEYEILNFAYLAAGHYAEQLQRFIDALGRHQVHVMLTEDLRDNPCDSVRQACNWLGCDATAISEVEHRRINVTSTSRFGAAPSRLRSLARKLLPGPFADQIRQRIVAPFQKWSEVPFTPPPMSERTRGWLVDYYRDKNDQLSEIIKRDLSSWSQPHVR